MCSVLMSGSYHIQSVVQMINTEMSNLMSQKQNAPHMTHHEIVRRLYLGFEPASPKLIHIGPENAE